MSELDRTIADLRQRVKERDDDLDGRALEMILFLRAKAEELNATCYTMSHQLKQREAK